MWHLWFIDNNWSWWESLDKPFGFWLSETTDPVAAASGWGFLDVIVRTGTFFFQSTYANGWQNFRHIASDA